jgi:carbamoyl-phosphate synthase small subunit
MQAALIFEDGTTFSGRLIGHEALVAGEVVFNTSMTGYQEILTDPSYAGQMVVLTYPLIGNYGTYAEAAESLFPWAEAVITHRMSTHPSHYGSIWDMDRYLKQYEKPGLVDVDTRQLTRYLRDHGTRVAVLVPEGTGSAEWQAKLAQVDLKESVYRVTTPSPIAVPGEGPHVVVVDYGAKNSIIRALTDRGARVTIVPAITTVSALDAFEPNGVVLSNGPGNPADVPELLPLVRHVIETYPTLGICLGHQLIALSEGATTYALKFGHHGGNHPLKDEETGKIMITAQNHGYAVNPDRILDRYRVRLRHLHDGTVEGLEHQSRPVLSVQHHPEAGPGPLDSLYLFDQFMDWVFSASRR